MTLDEFKNTIENEPVYLPEAGTLEVSGALFATVKVNLYSLQCSDFGALVFHEDGFTLSSILSGVWCAGFSGTASIDLQRLFRSAFALQEPLPDTMDEILTIDKYSRPFALKIDNDYIQPIKVCPFARCGQTVSNLTALRCLPSVPPASETAQKSTNATFTGALQVCRISVV